jgi:hypothetical protein
MFRYLKYRSRDFKLHPTAKAVASYMIRTFHALAELNYGDSGLNLTWPRKWLIQKHHRRTVSGTRRTVVAIRGVGVADGSDR